MKIAYFSPFLPIRSGISDFSEELVWKLKEHGDIVLFADKGIIQNEKLVENFDIMDINEYRDRKIRSQFDAAVFHVGNNYQFHKEIVEVFLEYGGILELHDIALHHFLAEATVVKGKTEEYVRAMKYCHGDEGEKVARAFLSGKRNAPWEKESLKYIVNKYLIDRAQAIIVHSDFAYEIVRGIRYNVPLIKIELHTPEIDIYSQERKNETRHKMGISEDKLILGAFGYASIEKRIVQILEALALYKKRDENFHFYIVGKVEQADILKRIERLGLQENVTVTGYVNLNEFKEFMMVCDVAFNLRYPTQGESSASLARLLGFGKVVFVTDIATFKEYPDDVVVKIEYGRREVKQIYENLLSIKERLDIYGKNSYQYALKHNNLDINSKIYMDFFQKIVNNEEIDDEYEDHILNHLFQIKLEDDDYVKHLCEKMQY